MSTIAPRDARSHVSATATLAAIEGRLLLRDPASLFTLAIPVFLLVVFGASSSAGATAVLPTTLATAIGLFGLYLVPTTLATYRERGILRRLSVTPLPPARLLGVQLLLQTVLALASCTLLVAVGAAMGAALPIDVVAFAAAVVVGLACLLSCGLLIGAVAPNGRAANGIGVLLYFPLAYLGGLILPPPLMPPAVLAIGAFTPLGALREALAAAWDGGGSALSLGVMAAYAVCVSLAAVTLFRWE
jgi:ABC-2 type transport system permease protein